MGQGAAKLVVSGSTCGCIDAKGNFQAITDGGAPDEANPMKTMRKYFNRRLAINQNGDVIGWGGEYNDGSRSVPEPARKKVKQVAMFYDTDFALTEDGNLYRWSKKGLLDQSEKIRSNIEKISIFAYTGFALSKSNDLYRLDGNLPQYWKEKARNVICRGELATILSMDYRWNIFAHRKTPMGNEIEVLGIVMNRPETIDVEFNLFYSDWKNNNTASYAVWIEDAGTPQLDITNVKSLPAPPIAPRKSGTGFFGTELD